jgi:LysM repeat protein
MKTWKHASVICWLDYEKTSGSYIFTLVPGVQVSAQEQFYIRHKVRWMETLYSIARKYKVEAKEIAILNNLTTGTVERGQILLIPDKDRIQANTDTTALEIPVPEEEIISDQTPARLSCADYRPSPSYRHNISLLLPLSGTRKQFYFLNSTRVCSLQPRK